jgi:predicted phage gp36 major capsid-like protein
MASREELETKVEAQLREWIAELESLKARADKAVAEARKNYYDDVDKLRAEIESKLAAWTKRLEAQAGPESGEAGAKTLVERLHAAIESQLRELRPLAADLRRRAEHTEREAKRLVQELRAKRQPAKAALGELKVGIERAWGELRVALDGALTKFREPPAESGPPEARSSGSGGRSEPPRESSPFH